MAGIVVTKSQDIVFRELHEQLSVGRKAWIVGDPNELVDGERQHLLPMGYHTFELEDTRKGILIQFEQGAAVVFERHLPGYGTPQLVVRVTPEERDVINYLLEPQKLRSGSTKALTRVFGVDADRPNAPSALSVYTAIMQGTSGSHISDINRIDIV